jgi:hypothetical protein
MEWLPKLWDTFDSGVFSARLLLAGYHGNRAKGVLKFGVIGSALVAYPPLILVGAIAVATYLFTEMSYRVCIATSRSVFTVFQR